MGRKRARARSGVSPLGVIAMSPVPSAGRESNDVDARTSPEAMLDSARATSTSPDGGAFSSAVSGKQTPDSSKSEEKAA